MYISPVAGATVSSSNPLNITWNPTCVDPTNNKVDIYMYAPSSANTRVHLWSNVPAQPATFVTEIMPKWWMATPTVALQLAVVPAGAPPFMASMPAGPIFTATYTAPADGSTPASADLSKPDDGVTNVGALGAKPKLSSGKVAAAVIMPLLILIGIGVAYYIKMSRTKSKEERKRFSEAVDKRMSTISTDWKSVTPGGARAAIRQSMASNRASGFAFGGIRPQSAAETGQNGARGLYYHENQALSSESRPQMSQLRPGARASTFSASERVSRVSFANDPRPKSGKWQDKNDEDVPVPPLPMMSPDQAKGPLTLTPEDIRARIQGQQGEDGARNSMDEVMPALSMMRTGGGEGTDVAENDDYLLWDSSSSGTPSYYYKPQPPTPAATLDRSPVGMMPMQAMPANVMSPDEMLRAYAQQRGATRDGPAAPTYPEPVANYNGGGMRTLYTPHGTGVMGGVGLGGRQVDMHYTTEDAYIGTAT